MKLIYHIGILSIILLFASCGKQDNYSAPNAGIKGTVVDANTKEGLQTEQPNGIKIRLLDTKYGGNVSPIDIWTKADGSFETTQLFTGSYKVIPVEGAFFNTDTVQVSINGITDVSFDVTPFLNITATAVKSGNDVVVNYKISRTKVSDKIIECKSLASAYPAVSNTINELAIQHDLSAITDDTILTTSYTDTLTSLQAGTTYYIRVAARTANAYNKYNYSKVIELKM